MTFSLSNICLFTSLNTRRRIGGQGTEQQGNTTNNTNMFHLGTRLPSMGQNEFDGWEKVTPSPSTHRGRSVLLDVPQHTYGKDEFPYNSFHPGARSIIVTKYVLMTSWKTYVLTCSVAAMLKLAKPSRNNLNNLTIHFVSWLFLSGIWICCAYVAGCNYNIQIMFSRLWEPKLANSRK
jgi:hypothetical protein